jgi:subtilase family serine protease
MAKAWFSPGIALGLAILGGSSALGAVTELAGRTITNNRPSFTDSAEKLGAVDPSTVIEVSIWLNPHNKADLDAVAKDLYNPRSPNYRHWLTKAEFTAKYAPTAAENKLVQEFFASHNLKVVSVGPDNFYVRAAGTVAAVNKAFNVSLNNYRINGKVVRGNDKDPIITGAAAPLVASVAGLDTLEYTHPLATRTSNIVLPKPAGGLQSAVTANITGSGSLPFDSYCFTGTRSETFNSNGSLPSATYTGNGYTNDSTGCGYTPGKLQEVYNLTGLYKEGYDGKGQTIVIIDWCGSPTITQDANAFSSQFNLPQLTSSNFDIIYTAPSECAAPDAEINIDVEWAHAIAPGAAIDLVVPPSSNFQDVDQAFFYAVNYQLGNVISGS